MQGFGLITGAGGRELGGGHVLCLVGGQWYRVSRRVWQVAAVCGSREAVSRDWLRSRDNPS
jgi:hypothetical protein